METQKLVRQLGRALITWSIASIIAGVILLLVPVGLLQGIGLQSVLWGIIDILIAVVGVFRNKEMPADKAARFLRINVFLDILYMLVGVLLGVLLGVFLWVDSFILGNGIGIIIQGAFLFILDLYFYRRFQLLDATSGILPESLDT